jgi:hypothetical protein
MDASLLDPGVVFLCDRLAAEAADATVACSPVCIQMLLATMLSAADEASRTHAELLDAWAAGSEAQVMEHVSAVATALRSINSVDCVPAVYTSVHVSKSAFKDRTRALARFPSMVRPLTDIGQINAVFRGGAVPDVIDTAFGADAQLVFAGLVFVCGWWAHGGFPAARTTRAMFRRVDGTDVPCDLMDTWAPAARMPAVAHVRRDGYGAAAAWMPFGTPAHGHAAGVWFILPDEGPGPLAAASAELPLLLEAVQEAAADGTAAAAAAGSVTRLLCPRLQITSTTPQVVPALREMGVRDAFDGTRASLGRLVNPRRHPHQGDEVRPAIDAVSERTTVQFFEEGACSARGLLERPRSTVAAEVAGATGGDIAEGMPVVTLRLTRPFFAVVTCRTTAPVLLFAARVMEPQAPPAA